MENSDPTQWQQPPLPWDNLQLPSIIPYYGEDIIDKQTPTFSTTPPEQIPLLDDGYLFEILNLLPEIIHLNEYTNGDEEEVIRDLALELDVPVEVARALIEQIVARRKKD